jgi:hypothetical protein
MPCCLQILPSLASLSIYINIYEHLIKKGLYDMARYLACSAQKIKVLKKNTGKFLKSSKHFKILP